MKKISFNKFWKINKEEFTNGLTQDQIKSLKIIMRNCYNSCKPLTSEDRINMIVNGSGQPTLEDRIHLTFYGMSPTYPKYISKELLTVLPKGEL